MEASRGLVFCVAAVTLIGCGSEGSSGAGPPPPPDNPVKNVLVIVTDDQRYDVMSYLPLTGSLLNRETVRFSRAFVTTSLCCPSRSTILTGLYAHNHGVHTNVAPDGGATVFDPSSTLAVWLAAHGYRTILAGKYLNDYDKVAPAVPPGWSSFMGLVLGSYYNYTVNLDGQIVSRGAAPTDYTTDYFADTLATLIGQVPDTVPLFLYYAPNAPHQPATAAPGDQGRYAGLPPYRPPSFNEADVSDKPAYVRNLAPLTSTEIATNDALRIRQLETLPAVDRAISRIIAALQQSARWDQTLVVFISDNGYMWGEHRMTDRKNCPYEECIRVPLWIRVPGAAARSDTSLVANLDLAPTIADWAGVTPPGAVNGTSLLPLIRNPALPWRSALLIEHWPVGVLPGPEGSGVRTHSFFYQEYTTGERELYDLRADPYELDNVVTDTSYAATVAQLQAMLQSLKGS